MHVSMSSHRDLFACLHTSQSADRYKDSYAFGIPSEHNDSKENEI